MKRTLLFSLLLVFLVAVFTFCALQVNAEETDGGKCGRTMTWSYDAATATLTIKGTGQMERYFSGQYPWSKYADEIKDVQISEEVTDIGVDSFDFFVLLESIYIPEGVFGYTPGAFTGCTSLDVVYFNSPSVIEMFFEDDNEWFSEFDCTEKFAFPVEGVAEYVCAGAEGAHISVEEYNGKTYYVYNLSDRKIASGHNYDWKYDAASHWAVCSGCGDAISFQSHERMFSSTLEEPTLEKEGIIQYTCMVCGFTYTTSIPKLNPPTQNPEKDPEHKPDKKPNKKPELVPLPEADAEEETTLVLPFTTYITVFTSVFCGVMLMYALNAILLVVIIRAVIKKHRNNEKTSE